MKLAPALVCLTVVAAVSAVFGAVVPPPPGPVLDANAAEQAEIARRAERPIHRPAQPAPRARSVEAIRLSGRLPADLRDPSVVATETGWRMWFVAGNGLQQATSNDGRDWRPNDAAVQVGDPLATLGEPTVVRGPRGAYRMWYEAEGRIRQARSSDGHRFEPAGAPLEGGPALGLEPGADVKLGSPEAVHRDGRFHLWFVAVHAGQASIAHATSFDGESWRSSTANPLPTLPAVGAGRPAVAWDQAAGRFAMWYRDDAGGWRHATSPDGDTWEGAAETPVAAADAVATGDGMRVYAAEPPTGPRGLLAGLLGAF